MATLKIYEQDPYQKSFTARVIQTEPDEQGFRVLLDQTAFYPASGGQPSDRGWLDNIPILDVLEDEGDPVHILPNLPSAAQVTGTLDWNRRFDFMQHHTGQHILSQALLKTCSAETVSFHLTAQTASIDVNIPDLSMDACAAAESLANEIVYANYSVKTRILTQSEAAALPWRSALPVELDIIRGVQIGSFDLCGCGGTHVAATGEIGIIKIIKTTGHRSGTRIHFACGARALADYRQKNQLIIDGARLLEIPEDNLVEAIQQLQVDHGALQKECRDLNRSLDQMTAQALWELSPQEGAIRYVSKIFSHCTLDRLKEMASYLINQPHTYVLLAASEPKPTIVFARSADLTPSMALLLKEVITPRGGRGGGQPQSAQGGGVLDTDLADILADAEKILRR